MKTEDIDKKIGMPDVDEEWAKFEREVLDKEAKTGKRVLMGWTAGIAASIALLAGIFLWGNGVEKQDGGGKELAKATNVDAAEKMNVTDGDETNAAPANNSSSVDTASNNEREHTPDNRETHPSNKRKDDPPSHLLAHKASQPTENVDEQAPAVDDMADDQNVFAVVEQQPSFRGGNSALQDFIKQHLRYPQLAQEYGVNGKVIMQFKIDCSGYISEVKAVKHLLKYDTLLLSRESESRQIQLKEQISQQLEEECARVIAMMPRWTPSKMYGKAVSTKYNLPFLFQPVRRNEQ